MPRIDDDSGLTGGNQWIKEIPGIGPVMPTSSPIAPSSPVAPVPGRWVTPDNSASIPGSWEMINAGAESNRMIGQAESDFQKMFRQSFIDWGGDASKVGDYRKYLDPATIQAAQQNKLSRTALSLQAMQKARDNARAQLAGKGMSRSGANTKQMRDILDQREQNDYGNLRTFLSAGDQGYSSLASAKERAAASMWQARKDAEARLAAENPSTLKPGY